MSLACGRPSASAGVLVALTWGLAASEVFLGPSGGHRDAELHAAMASVMGCGAPAGVESHAQVDDMKLALAPMWDTLPKNRWGNIEWRMLRYVAHRHFIRKSSLLVRGLEPSKLVNSSELGSAEVLSGAGNSIVDAALKGKLSGQGFSLDDAALLLATLQQVIYDTESTRLERAYREKQYNPAGMLMHDSLATVIETYMMLWVVGEDEGTIAALVRFPERIEEMFPQWGQVRDFAVGVVRKMEFEASVNAAPGMGRAAMELSYSFADAHRAVGHITNSFASFWETECQTIKASLTELDRLGTGRVAMSDFYGSNSDGNWRFGESVAYLRELGALDESSTLSGMQVIIPNYLQGASNCIVATPYYLVCCVSECEGVVSDIQEAAGGPLATPAAVLDVVGRIENYDDESPTLGSTLTAQLGRIAKVHGGLVPLHGRLFAQWLHYAFPHECPYPHKAGTTSAASVHDFGDASYVCAEEVHAHSRERRVSSEDMGSVDEAQWMSQWSEEEELLAEHRLGAAPWERTGVLLSFGCAATAMLGVAWSLTSFAVESSAGSMPKKQTHFL